MQTISPPSGTTAVAVPFLRGHSIANAAVTIGISEKTLRRMIVAGDVASVKVSARRRVITETEIARILSGGLATAA